MTFSVSCLTTAFDKQLQITKICGGYRWHIDLAIGRLSFGNQYHLHAQLLGTASEASGDWLWTWANTASRIPAHLFTAIVALNAYCEQQGLPELTMPQLQLSLIRDLRLFRSPPVSAKATPTTGVRMKAWRCLC